MHFLLSILDFLVFVFDLILKFLYGLGIVCALSLAYGAIRFLALKGSDRLKMTSNPRCLCCGRLTLKRYASPFAASPDVWYYGCIRCDARFKRTASGEWITQRPGMAKTAEIPVRPVKRLYYLTDSFFEKFANPAEIPVRIVKRTSVLEKPNNLSEAERQSLEEDPLGSWFGSVQVALPGEEWPEYEGVPMLPLCQLRCEAIPTLPSALEKFALVCVFLATMGDEAVSPHGERWVIRTYRSLDGLVPITYPGDTVGIRACPVTWSDEADMPQNPFCLPEEAWFDYMDYYAPYSEIFHGRTESKAGGHGWVTEEEALARQNPQAEFAFQIEVKGEFPGLFGPGGTFCFTYDRVDNADSWFLKFRQSRPTLTGSKIMSVPLECALDGLQLYVQKREELHCPYEELAISYKGSCSIVHDLGYLRGLVRITTGEMALQFVRLRTCNYLQDCTLDSIAIFEEFEVLTQAEYSVQPEWNCIPHSAEWRRPMARTVLDPKTFAALGFEPAHVEAVEGGFRITRWTCHRTHLPWRNKDTDDTYEYLKIEETVQTDGTYTRTLLRKYHRSDSELLHPTSGPNQTDPSELLRPSD